MNTYNNIEDLKLSDKETIDILGEDIAGEKNIIYDNIKKFAEAHKGNLYKKTLYDLTGLELTEEDAKQKWYDILKHKYFISEKLGRNAGIRVAALDYLLNISKEIEQVRLINEKEYSKTLVKANFDSLTGLLKKDVFIELAERSFINNKISFVLVFFDIDNFKEYNDINGHLAGDIVLREMGIIISNILQKNDLAGRFGGEEFIIAFKGAFNEDIKNLIITLRKTIKEFYFPNEELLKNKKLTVSGGTAIFPDEADNFNELISLADQRLYSIKNKNKNFIYIPEK